MQENQVNKSKAGIIRIFVLIIIIIGVCIIGIVSYNNSPDGKYNALIRLGNKFLMEENYEQAKLTFDEAINIDPDKAEAYGGFAKVCLAIAEESGKYEDILEAKKAYETVLEMDNSIAEVKEGYTKVSISYIEKIMSSKYYREALEFIQTAKKLVPGKEFEEKEEEIEKLIEEEETAEKERQKKREQEEQARLEEEKQKKEILFWLLWKYDLIKDYPVSAGFDKENQNIYHLYYGLSAENYEHGLKFNIEGDIWTISEHVEFDAKSGMPFEVGDGVGQTYDMTITEEVKQEFLVYKKHQDDFEQYGKYLSEYLVKNNSSLTKDFELEQSYFEVLDSDGKLLGTYIFHEKESSFFPCVILLQVKVDTTNQRLSFENTRVLGMGEHNVDLNELRGEIEISGNIEIAG